MKLNRFLALLLSVAMLMTLGLSALAEDVATEDATVTEEAAIEPALPSDDTVLATVNGEDVTWGGMVLLYNNYYANYAGYAEDSVIQTIALQEAVDRKILMQKAKELGLDGWTDEEKTSAEQMAQDSWDNAVESYLNAQALPEDATEEEKQAKRDEGNALFLSEGYSVERLVEEYRQSTILNRVIEHLEAISAPDDAAVQARYEERLVGDQELYQADTNAYINASNGGDVTPLYRPEGLRQVKHILLSVDAELLNNYISLLARLEEQADAEISAVQSGEINMADPTPDPAAEPEATEAPVTQADVDVAKAAILDSLKDKIDDINTRFAGGEDFDVLIDEYGTDPGMQDPTMRAQGYVLAQDSVNYIPEFVTGSFSIAAPGEISAPVIGAYGVHIIYYIGDLPAGSVELTDEIKAELVQILTNEKATVAYQEWIDAAEITFTGVIQSYEELMAAEDGDATADN